MTVKVEYFSDVLCIWAWIAQRRHEELVQQFGDKISVEFHYVNVFGDTTAQIGEKWASRGGFDGFGQHVIGAAAPFPNAPVVADIWQKVRPRSSVPAHAILKATEISHSAAAAEKFARSVRNAFFTGPVDIGRTDVLLHLAAETGLDTVQIKDTLESGAAHAAVMRDYQMAQSWGIKGSPSWVLDGGRQILYGNVGYRVLRANAVELLNQPQEEASWC